MTTKILLIKPNGWKCRLRTCFEDKILRISREKPWARLSPLTDHEIVTPQGIGPWFLGWKPNVLTAERWGHGWPWFRNLRTDADLGLFGYLPKLYSYHGRRQFARHRRPAKRRRFQLGQRSTPTNLDSKLNQTSQYGLTTVIYQSKPAG